MSFNYICIYIILYYTILYSIILYYIYYAILYSTILYYTILYSIVLYYILCYVMLWYIVLYEKSYHMYIYICMHLYLHIIYICHKAWGFHRYHGNAIPKSKPCYRLFEERKPPWLGNPLGPCL